MCEECDAENLNDCWSKRFGSDVVAPICASFSVGRLWCQRITTVNKAGKELSATTASAHWKEGEKCAWICLDLHCFSHSHDVNSHGHGAFSLGPIGTITSISPIESTRKFEPRPRQLKLIVQQHKHLAGTQLAQPFAHDKTVTTPSIPCATVLRVRLPHGATHCTNVATLVTSQATRTYFLQQLFSACKSKSLSGDHSCPLGFPNIFVLGEMDTIYLRMLTWKNLRE